MIVKYTLKKGFTLIELLIVIVIIGILAAAVISAINPVEQIKKARDARKASNAAELQKALDVYYVSNLRYPWSITPVTTDDPVAPGGTGQNLATVAASAAASNWLLVLGNSADVKNTIASRDYTGMLIWADITNGSIVCFVPESQAYQAKRGFTNTGTPVATGGTMYCSK